MSTQKDYYAILGVSPDADRATIEESYDRLAKEVQPNVGLEPTNPERMRELDEAFDVLDDPARRAEYDRGRGTAGDSEMAPPVRAEGDEAAAAAGVDVVTAERAESVADEGLEGPPGPEPSGEPTKKRGAGSLIGGIALLAGGVAALAAGILLLGITLTDDDSAVLEGFTETASGLQYQDVVAGTGDPPADGQIATVHYTGTLADGSQFDTSVGKVPLSFVAGATGLIPGFEEGVSTMKVGGQRTLVLPPELAWGEEGSPPTIPANATVVFDVRLFAVSDPPAATPPDVSGEETELEGGLRTIDLVEGTGNAAASGNLVAVHYTGWLAGEGTRFDTSLGRDANTPPAVLTFTVGEGAVIEGWDAGLPGMKEGGKRRLIIPAALAYGDQAQGDLIPANADLIFDIELVEIAE